MQHLYRRTNKIQSNDRINIKYLTHVFATKWRCERIGMGIDIFQITTWQNLSSAKNVYRRYFYILTQFFFHLRTSIIVFLSYVNFEIIDVSIWAARTNSLDGGLKWRSEKWKCEWNYDIKLSNISSRNVWKLVSGFQDKL